MAEIVNSEKLSPQPWIVVNRTGGAGLNGFKYLLDQSGDAHTIGAITPSMMAAVLQQKVDVDWRKALPVGNLIVDPQILVVHSKFPQKTVDEFIAAAKAKPGIRSASPARSSARRITSPIW